MIGLFGLIARIRDSRLPKLTLMEALAQVELLSNQEGHEQHGDNFSRKRPGEDEPVIANVRLAANVAQPLVELFSPLVARVEGGGAIVRGNFLSAFGVPETEMETASVTRILAERFPRLQLRNLWVTTGGPKSNNAFCYFVLMDLVQEFNNWAQQSGFAAHVEEARLDSDFAYEVEFGDVKMCLTSPWRWSGVAEEFSLDGDRLTLSWRGHEYGFFSFTYDASLENAVAMLDTFMKSWTPKAELKAA